jgi:hypothetical protein
MHAALTTKSDCAAAGKTVSATKTKANTPTTIGPTPLRIARYEVSRQAVVRKKSFQPGRAKPRKADRKAGRSVAVGADTEAVLGPPLRAGIAHVMALGAVGIERALGEPVPEGDDRAHGA